MAGPAFESESFDLIWSEGALYNIGIEHGLRLWQSLLRRGGCIAFTDAVWRKENPPDEVRAGFAQDYPQMGWTVDILAVIDRCGLKLLGHFTLPDKAWWDDFYSPMEKRVQILRHKHSHDAEALKVLDLIGREVEIHRKYSNYYAYEFFVVQRNK
jgi:hypothetical protein